MGSMVSGSKSLMKNTTEAIYLYYKLKVARSNCIHISKQMKMDLYANSTLQPAKMLVSEEEDHIPHFVISTSGKKKSIYKKKKKNNNKEMQKDCVFVSIIKKKG